MGDISLGWGTFVVSHPFADYAKGWAPHPDFGVIEKVNRRSKIGAFFGVI